MALKLMDPINQMPFFQGNQVLTYNHLNDLAAYLYQQERYTRNKLIGTGIVCALTFNWKTLLDGNAEVLIDDGCAVTSAGYLIVFKQPHDENGALIPYTHRRNFTRLKDFEPFKTVIGNGNPTIYELITEDEFDAETEVPKSILNNANKTNRVLILLYDIEALNIAKCLDESCDDKGKLYQYTPRPLLVPLNIIDAIINAPNTETFFTEPGRSWKGKEELRFTLDQLWVKNLFKNNNLQNVNTPADLVTLFKAPCLDAELNFIRDRINALIDTYPWIFNTLYDCLKSEVPALTAQKAGEYFKTKAQTYRNTAANNNYIQYLYDFLRDCVDAYNELLTSVADLVGECGGNEFIHPFHVMLGYPVTKDHLACYQEEKYAEHNFKYRHEFIPSPVMNGQFMLYERVQSLFKRLIRIIDNFQVNFADTPIRISPSRDYETLLAERAIPYFYKQSSIDKIKQVWNYDLTNKNKISRIKGYQLPFTQDQLLDEDTRRNDFYRIEGHIGSPVTSVQTTIDTLRKTYNLPFTVAVVSIQSTSKNKSCSFPDLQEEYNYYRDRVLGYLREIERWLDYLEDMMMNNAQLKPFYEKVLSSIKLMHEILLNIRCLEKFVYAEYKKAYVQLWEAVYDLYTESMINDISNANQALNSSLNIFNIFFFRPIYRIWYMYQYRLIILSQSEVISLKSLASNTTGLEHLAGVRRGETFLLVSDTAQNNLVVADFNLPDLLRCACDCLAAPCDDKKRAIVSPLQKPIVMVVDVTATVENSIQKSKAHFDPATGEYFLDLDEMGFYKADSEIKAEVKIMTEDGNPFHALVGLWYDQRLSLRLRKTDNEKLNGYFILKYQLAGDFEEVTVEGFIHLFIIGKTSKPSTGKVDVTMGSKVQRLYLYDKALMKKTKPEMKIDAVTKNRTIGGERVKVYTSTKGNEMAVYYDAAGAPYLKMINIVTPGVEELPLILTSSGSASRSSVAINVIDKNDKMAQPTIRGTIKSGDGVPLADVKVRSSSDKEAVTNEKGEYIITGVKSGEIITIEKQGYKTVSVQANSALVPDMSLAVEPLLNIKALEGIPVPDHLKNLTEGLSFSALRNLIK
ncbi:MAG: carboxypeptidase-like regulatory domain-containing protein [Saprospiraceae bacterium]|nr:carboxypeptidase-like regulatory domain-containing protein [Saprospiraceae bacterium]